MVRKSQQETAAELYERWKHLNQEYSALRGQQEGFIDQYFGKHWITEKGPAEGEERITLPTQANTVDMAFSVLMAQRRSIHAIPVQNTTDAQQITSDLEKFLHGVFYVNEVRTGEDRLALACWNALVKKVGWIRYRWDEELAKTEMAQSLAAPVPPVAAGPYTEAIAQPPPAPTLSCKELPIVLDCLDPGSIVAKFGGYQGILYLFYGAKRMVDDIEAEFGPLKMEPYRTMSPKDKAQTEVEFLEYWGYEKGVLKTATLIEKQFINGRELREARGYDRIPYVPIYCFRTAQERPHERMRGILENMGDLVHIKEKMLTRQGHALKMFALMPLVANQGQRNDPIEVDTSLGTVIHLRSDQSISFPQYPGSPPDFKWHLGVLDTEVQQSGFPAVAFGQGPATTSGYAIGQYNEGARARLNLPRQNLELALTTLCQGIISLCVNFAPNSAIPVFGRYKNEDFYMTLTGNQMKGHIIQVNINSDMPGDDVKKAVIGGQLKTSGVLSDRTIMERWLAVENVEDEEQQMLRERAMKHPTVQLMAMAKSLMADKSPYAQAIVAEIVKALQQLQMPAQAPGQVPPAAMSEQGGAPPPNPMGAPSAVIPSIAQGQVLRQEVGLPPTEQEMGVPPAVEPEGMV